MGCNGASWGRLVAQGASCCSGTDGNQAFGVALGGLWTVLERLGPTLGRLGAVLGRLWAILGWSYGALGSHFGRPDAIGRTLKIIEKPLVFVGFCGSGAPWRTKWRPHGGSKAAVASPKSLKSPPWRALVTVWSAFWGRLVVQGASCVSRPG